MRFFIKGILTWAFVLSISPVFSEAHLCEKSKKIEYSLSEAEAILSQHWKNLTEHDVYDRAVFYLAAQEKEKTKKTKRSSRELDSRSAYMSFGTTNCIGILRIIQQSHKKDVPFKLALATLPKFIKQPKLPIFSHVALFYENSEGVALFDPAFLYPGILVFKKGEDKQKVDLGARGVWVFEYVPESQSVSVQIRSKDGVLEDYFYYDLNPVSEDKTDVFVTEPFFRHDRKVLIFPYRRSNEPFLSLVLNFSKKPYQIEVTEHFDNAPSVEWMTYPFEEYYKEPNSLDKQVSEKLADEFRMSKSALIKRLKAVMDAVRSDEVKVLGR